MIPGEIITPDDDQAIEINAGAEKIELLVANMGDRLAWAWPAGASALELPLWPALWSAAELLMAPELARVRECESCSWLFLDTSRNHTRRWCSMEDCGNVAKARRHYARRHARS